MRLTQAIKTERCRRPGNEAIASNQKREVGTRQSQAIENARCRKPGNEASTEEAGTIGTASLPRPSNPKVSCQQILNCSVLWTERKLVSSCETHSLDASMRVVDVE